MKPLVNLCLLHMTKRITGPCGEDGGDGGADGEHDAVALEHFLGGEEGVADGGPGVGRPPPDVGQRQQRAARAAQPPRRHLRPISVFPFPKIFFGGAGIWGESGSVP